RIWSATDAAGNFASCQQTISVVDFDPPVIEVPPPLVLECNGPGGVTTDDPAIQAWVALATAVDECGDAEHTVGLPAILPAGCAPGETTNVIFTAIDECGNSDFAISTVTVVDSTPPELACSADVTMLWPANHKWVDIGFSALANDVCDPDGVT